MLAFEVWCPDIGETATDSRTVKADEAEEAAELWADHFYRKRDGWEVDSWPLTCHVRNADGVIYAVDVDLSYSVDFTACAAERIKTSVDDAASARQPPNVGSDEGSSGEDPSGDEEGGAPSAAASGEDDAGGDAAASD